MRVEGFLRDIDGLYGVEFGGLRGHLRTIHLNQCVKYSWFYFLEAYIESIVHSKYEGEERVHKTRSLLKLSFDSLFYTFVTVFAYVLFRDEYWFPSMAGGCGSCSQIYK